MKAKKVDSEKARPPGAAAVARPEGAARGHEGAAPAAHNGHASMKAKKVASEKTATGGTGTSHSEGARAESASDTKPQHTASTLGGRMAKPQRVEHEEQEGWPK
jgi:hypothetical protein